MLWFLVALAARRNRFRSYMRESLARNLRPAGRYTLRLKNGWAGVRHDSDAMTIHSIWQYEAGRHIAEEEPSSCGISFLY